MDLGPPPRRVLPGVGGREGGEVRAPPPSPGQGRGRRLVPNPRGWRGEGAAGTPTPGEGPGQRRGAAPSQSLPPPPARPPAPLSPPQRRLPAQSVPPGAGEIHLQRTPHLCPELPGRLLSVAAPSALHTLSSCTAGTFLDQRQGRTRLRGHGQAEQQAAAGDAAGPAGEHGVHGAGAAGVVQGLPQGLPHRHPQRGRVQEDLRQLLPLRRRLQVRRARLPHLRHQQRRHHRLPGVHHRAERDLARPPGAEAHVGLQHVRPGRQRLHQPRGDAGDRAGHLQDGFVGDEDAGRRVDPREED